MAIGAAARRASGVLLFFFVAAAAFAEQWPQFGWNAARTSAPTVSMGITAANLHLLKRQRIRIDGTVDSSAIYLSHVRIGGARRDAFFVTTTYGKTLAIDAATGKVLWQYTPPSYERLAGSYRITTATPVAGPKGRYIYAAAPDGKIRKLAVSNGRLVWSTSITRLPEREKIASPLGYSHGKVIAATDGYIGDEPPYQGHVAVLDAGSGRLLHVWNSLCSNQRSLLEPSSCPQSDSGIWGRAGVVVNPTNGNLFLATGNGNWNGSTDWGDSVIELSPNATRMLGNYTPPDTRRLDLHDVDLGSTSPALLGNGLVAQGGKGGWIHLLDWRRMRGSSPHRGGELARVHTPASRMLFTAPAVWHHAGKTWLFAADNGGTSSWTVTRGGFHLRWHAGYAGTSPVIADGLAFIYDPYGGLVVYQATTGKKLAVLSCGRGHWNSPIVVDGRIALPVGNANNHSTSGFLDIWRLPHK